MLICILEHELRLLLGMAGLKKLLAMEPVAGMMLSGQQVAWREFSKGEAMAEVR